MRVLFVDDDLDNVRSCAEAVRARASCEMVATVEAAVRSLLEHPAHVLVMDLFIPLGDSPRSTLGPRARKYEEHVEHLGGLVLLDELARFSSPPRLILHTACTDPPALALARERGAIRVRKPAPAEFLLQAVLRALDEAEE